MSRRPLLAGRGKQRIVVGLLGDQRVAYVLVGATNVVVFMVLFVLAYGTLGDDIGYMGCLVSAYVLAILCAFALHRYFVFKVRGQVWGDLLRFTLVNLGTLAINAVLLPVLVELAGLPVLPAQVLAVVVTVVLNYFGHRHFSFRRAAPLASADEEPTSD